MKAIIILFLLITYGAINLLTWNMDNQTGYITVIEPESRTFMFDDIYKVVLSHLRQKLANEKNISLFLNQTFI